MLQWNMALACQVNSNHFEWLMFHSTMIIEERINLLSETFATDNSLHPGGLPFIDFCLSHVVKFFESRSMTAGNHGTSGLSSWAQLMICLVPPMKEIPKRMPFKKTWSREIEKIASEKVPLKFSGTPTSNILILHEQRIFQLLGFVKVLGQDTFKAPGPLFHFFSAYS